MTALRKYQRLESPGLWRETPDERLREVVVDLREATLILADPKTERPLSQWSLPAVLRMNPGEMPALYCPGATDSETLEIDDRDMVAALDTVQNALERRRPRPGRLRGVLGGGLGAVALVLAVFWLPGKLLDYTAVMLPRPTQAALGLAALADVVKLTGSPCSASLGASAADTLARRLNPQDPPHLLVLREGLKQPARLPGGVILLPLPLIEKADGPDAVGGYVLAEMVRADSVSATRDVLSHAGLWATVRLLASGTIGANAMTGYGTALLSEQPPPLAPDMLLAAMKTLGLSSSAYAYAVDASGETTLPLIEGDPFPKGSEPALLDDAGWLSLQSICG